MGEEGRRRWVREGFSASGAIFEGVADGHAETGSAHFVEGDLPRERQGSRRGRGCREGRRHERLHHGVGARPVGARR